ncbi:MAG: hypothetical protein HUU55_23790, partial [Myxococcales bacterium]|nr:hypothetical protein [Myxococcales bacterium]
MCQQGKCVSGGPTNCDDKNACTSDACTPSAGCVHANLTGGCNDNNPCTTSDTCQNGLCSGT